jgi:hypothetical protein
MPRIEVSRPMAAEPSGVALVLAGPAARELWPHRHLHSIGAADTTVTLTPPVRSGVGFVARLLVSDADRVVAEGRLAINPTGTGEGPASVVSVHLVVLDPDVDVRRSAETYLDNVARVAQERSTAA